MALKEKEKTKTGEQVGGWVTYVHSHTASTTRATQAGITLSHLLLLRAPSFPAAPLPPSTPSSPPPCAHCRGRRVPCGDASPPRATHARTPPLLFPRRRPRRSLHPGRPRPQHGPHLPCCPCSCGCCLVLRPCWSVWSTRRPRLPGLPWPRRAPLVLALCSVCG